MIHRPEDPDLQRPALVEDDLPAPLIYLHRGASSRELTRQLLNNVDVVLPPLLTLQCPCRSRRPSTDQIPRSLHRPKVFCIGLPHCTARLLRGIWLLKPPTRLNGAQAVQQLLGRLRREPLLAFPALFLNPVVCILVNNRFEAVFDSDDLVAIPLRNWDRQRPALPAPNLMPAIEF